MVLGDGSPRPIPPRASPWSTSSSQPNWYCIPRLPRRSPSASPAWRRCGMRRTCRCGGWIGRPSTAWSSSPAPHPAGACPNCSMPRRQAGVRPDIEAVVALLRQLLPAAALFSRNRQQALGTLGAERLFIVPPARVVIAEAAFGSAIDQLQLSRADAWQRYQLAMPPARGSRGQHATWRLYGAGPGGAFDAARPPPHGRRVPRGAGRHSCLRRASVMATTITRWPACSHAGCGARYSWTRTASSRRTPRRWPSRKCSPATGDTSPAPMP